MFSLRSMALVIAVVAAGCGGGSVGQGPATDPAVPPAMPAETATSTTAGLVPAEPDTTVAEASPPTSDRPPAPDFTLALGGGGSFTLSAESRPVFLVFWAEW